MMGGNNYPSWTVAVAAVMALVAGIGHWVGSEVSLRDEYMARDMAQGECLEATGIEVVQWPTGASEGGGSLSESEARFVLELLERQQPYIIKGSSFGSGRGWTRWTPEYLGEVGPFWAAGVHQGSEERFVYYNRGTAMQAMAENTTMVHSIQRDGRKAAVPVGPDYSTQSMPLAAVLQAALSSEGEECPERRGMRRDHDSYLYWSTEIQGMGSKVSADVHKALSSFVMPSERSVALARELFGEEEGSMEAGGEHINAWVGEEGVTASLHYDTSHNFYFQQYGEKQFLLLPPERVWDVYLGPALHPHYRRSQVGALFHDAYIPPCRAVSLQDEWPLLDVEGARRAVLAPGDVLYLPPYWLHHVTALSFSLSVNVWHNSEQYWEAEAAAASPIPLEAEWHEEKFVCGTIAFLTEAIVLFTHPQEEELLRSLWPKLQRSRVVQEMCPGGNDEVSPSLLGLFLARLLHSRYEPAVGVVPSSSTVSHHWRTAIAMCSAIEDWGEEPMEARLQRGMESLGRHFLAASLSPSVRGLAISNYVEAVLNAFVGVEHVHPLLQEWMSHSLCPNTVSQYRKAMY